MGARARALKRVSALAHGRLVLASLALARGCARSLARNNNNSWHEQTTTNNNMKKNQTKPDKLEQRSHRSDNSLMSRDDMGSVQQTFGPVQTDMWTNGGPTKDNRAKQTGPARQTTGRMNQTCGQPDWTNRQADNAGPDFEGF